MIPINVTHTAIVTNKIHRRLLNPSDLESSTSIFPEPATNLRHTLSTLISFFADTYKSTFGFNDGPPLHDALTIAYVAQPDLFKATRYRVDIELTGTHSLGQTVVDIWKYIPCDDTWGRQGRNCLVAESLNVGSYPPAGLSSFYFGYILTLAYPQVERFFDLFLEAVSRCDEKSPLNKNNQLS
jgi:uridine nucleosidase